MQPANVEIVGLGEVLWDLLPAGPQLGGAPFNFTFHCHQLGHASAMVSRVGADLQGQAIRATLRNLGLSDTFLQEDPGHATGTVPVTLDEQGQPTFTITPNVAYDYLAWEDALEPLFAQARAVCFGTLAQRCPVARQTVHQALASASKALVVYDVNLRQHFFSAEILETSLQASDWAKLNEDELIMLRDTLGLRGTMPSVLLADLRQRYGLQLVALTRGARGCLVQSAEDEVDVPGVPVSVVDTVGAGDAFTAGLLVYALEGKSLSAAALFANHLAARVAAAGGTPAIHRGELERCSGDSRSPAR
jgi:fructokinase